MGNVPYKFFFNSAGITKKRGTVKTWNGYKIVPTLHPAYLIRGNRHLESGVISDLKLAKSFLNNKHTKVHTYVLSKYDEIKTLADKIVQVGRVACDIETTGLDCYSGDVILGIGFAFDRYTGFYIPIRSNKVFGIGYDFSIEKKSLSLIKDIIESQHIKKTFHNSTFDLEFLKYDLSISCKGLAADSMVLSHILNENTSNKLEYQTNTHYPDLVGFKDRSNSALDTLKTKSFANLPLSIISERCILDAIATYRLTEDLTKEIKQDKDLFNYYKTFQLNLLPVLLDIQLWGFKIDRKYAKEVRKKYEFALKNISEKIFKDVNYKFNINSPYDICKLLFGHLKLPILKYTKKSEEGGSKKTPSTEYEVLIDLYEKTNNPILKRLVTYKKVSKLQNTYAIGMINNAVSDIVHCNLNITGTSNSRISSSSPNQQNISNNRLIKRMIVSRDGYKFLMGDLKQCEVRVFAHLANDDKLLEACTSSDIYINMASEMFHVKERDVTESLRDLSKEVTLATLYQMGEHLLAKKINSTVARAREIQHTFFSTYTNAHTFVRNTIRFVKKYGYVRTAYGRIRRLPDALSGNDKLVARAERQAVNAMVQIPSADYVNYSLIRVHNALKDKDFGGSIVITVHDSIVVEIKEEQLEEFAPIFDKCMTESIPPIDVPMVVDLKQGYDWWNLEKYII